MQVENQQDLLNEILMTPSDVVIDNRFAQPSNDANCSGKCETGICKGLA